MNNLLATSQNCLKVQEQVFKTSGKWNSNNMHIHTHKAICLLQAICSHKKLLEGYQPLRVCVGWSKEFVCDRLHLSFGQSQAVSAVHRELNCSDCVTLDHGFELHDHTPHLKHTISNIFQ